MRRDLCRASLRHTERLPANKTAALFGNWASTPLAPLAARGCRPRSPRTYYDARTTTALAAGVRRRGVLAEPVPSPAARRTGRALQTPRVPVADSGGGRCGCNQDGKGAQSLRPPTCFLPRRSCGCRSVEVVRETSTLLWCRAGGREFITARAALRRQAQSWGPQGSVVPDWFAHDHGLRW